MEPKKPLLFSKKALHLTAKLVMYYALFYLVTSVIYFYDKIDFAQPLSAAIKATLSINLLHLVVFILLGVLLYVKKHNWFLVLTFATALLLSRFNYSWVLSLFTS